MHKALKKQLKVVINIVVFLLCVFLLVRKVDIPSAVSQARKVHFSIFILTVSLSIFRTWLSGLRWELLHPNRENRMSKWSYFRLSMLSHLFNLFMPGALGGDIIKTAYALNEGQGQKVKKVIGVFVDRTIGLISIMILGMIALLASHKELPISLWQALMLFIVSGGFIFFLFNSRVIGFFEGIAGRISFTKRIVSPLFKNWKESIQYYKGNSKRVLYSLALCIPIHMVSFMVYFILAKSMGMEIKFLEMVFAVAIMWLITAVPISIGGMGVRELSLVWLLGLFGVPSEQAVSLAVLGYINAIIKSVIVLPLLFDFRKKDAGQKTLK